MAMVRDLVRDEVVLSARTWVVKVGTSVLTGPDGTLDPARIGHLAEQISAVMDTGRKVALVSSGAVGAGIGQLGLQRRPDNLRQLQAAAAVGQAYLIRAYDEGFRRHGRHAAQLLLTHEDFDSRPRYLNMRNTLHGPVRVGRRADHQRERHDQRRRDQVRRQRPARRDGHEPAPGAAAGDPERGRRPLPRPTPARASRGEVVPLVPQIDDDDPRPGRRRAGARWGPAGCGASSRRPGW